MNHLLRDLAPISAAGWELLDDEARERLQRPARGPPAGRLLRPARLGALRHQPRPQQESRRPQRRRGQGAPAPGAAAGRAAGRLRDLPRRARDNDRGALDADLEPLDAAAKQIAVSENVAVFHGWAKAGIAGIAEASSIAVKALGKSAEDYPRSVARAVEAIRQGGVEGPYGLALGPDEFTQVIETAEHGGYPLFDHLAKILGGPIVWAPGVKGAVVLSLRGGDFIFESGQDLAIGYSHHDADSVHLYLEESFSFVVATPEAAAPLNP